MVMKEILARVLEHELLSREEMRQILLAITRQEINEAQITALLACLQMRGISVDELLGFRDGILETGVPALLLAVIRRIRSTSQPVPASWWLVLDIRWQSMVTWQPHR